MLQDACQHRPCEQRLSNLMMKLSALSLCSTLLGLLASCSSQGSHSSRFTELAELPFEENRPTEATTKTLQDELLFQRATQAYLWAMPLVNTLGMKEGSEGIFGAGYHVLPV